MPTHSHERPNERHDKADHHGRVHDARDAATRAYSNARDAAADAARRTAEGIESNPLGILVGGLAVGALAGALLPRSTREKELLAPLGQQIGNRARQAFDAAKSAGMDELDQRGLTRDGVRDQAKGLLDGLGNALRSAGSAAANSAQAGSVRGTGSDQAG